MEASQARSVSCKSSASRLQSTRSVLEQGNLNMSKGIDLCFLMDCTSSMHSWLVQAKEKLFAVQDEAHKIDPGCSLRVAFVGYRDIKDATRFEVFDFHEAADFAALKTKIGNVKATGGADAPEDVAGGLARAGGLAWRHRTRLMVHVADAPCHGTKYHSCQDDYPEGDPEHQVPEQLLRGIMAQKNVDYFFLKINSSTDQMTDLFHQEVRDVNRLFEVHNMTGSDASVFMHVVVDSIARSTAAWKTGAPAHASGSSSSRGRSASRAGSASAPGSRSRSRSRSKSSSRSRSSAAASSYAIGTGGGAGFGGCDSDSDEGGPGL
jgi:hypothetical protein